jgi:thymidylate synthase
MMLSTSEDNTVSTANTEETQYLELVKSIIETGHKRPDRTGVGTLSKFGGQHRWSLSDGKIPLFTTKRVFWLGVIEELLWFISGNTNSKVLSKKGVHIWNGNGTREFLDGRGLHHRDEGDLGPIYSHQWRHYGAAYKTSTTDYTGQGIDQLSECIRLIREEPTSRRIILNSWNPSQLHEMALPPCHVMCQFYVADGKLSCMMYQRSCDMGLGVPFNVASYSLLTHMIAHITSLQPGEFIHSFGDAHVYTSHVDGLNEQLKRVPRPFPTLKINRVITSIDDFTTDDFELIGYNPQGVIKMPMAT